MSNFNDSRGYQGNTNESVDVKKMIRENASDLQVLNALRSKYPNDVDLVNKLFSEYEEKMSHIRKKAQKFANVIIAKYNSRGPKEILEKAKKYKKKYSFSDEEFDAFLQIALSDKSFSSSNVILPNTPMSKTLGYSIDIPSKMSVKSTDLDVLQDILRMHQESSALHAQVVIQALTYDQGSECRVLVTQDPSKMFDPRRDNMYSSVHPVLFALFAPKIPDVENRMLLGSIASVVATRYNGTQFKTQPDWLLYHDLIQDPNEVINTNTRDSPMIDLRNRVKVQCELWKCVRDLRQGRFYAPDCTNFLVALKACKNNVYDSPDFAYIEDEGSVLRRLLSVFAYRPTIVAVKNMTNPIPFSVNASINTLAMTQVTTVPILNIPLPTNAGPNENVPLTIAFERPDWYVENKVLIPKTKAVVHTRDVIFFYINRRVFSVDHTRLLAQNMMPQFSVLPFSISGYENINETRVQLPGLTCNDIVINGKKYTSKSIVAIETQKINTNNQAGLNNDARTVTFVKGCSAVVLCGNRTGNGSSFGNVGTDFTTLQNTAVVYDPLNVDPTTHVLKPLYKYDTTEQNNAVLSSKATIVVCTSVNETERNVSSVGSFLHTPSAPTAAELAAASAHTVPFITLNGVNVNK